MTVGKIEVAQHGVVEKALENNILVAGRPSIVNSTQSIGPARSCVGVRHYKARVFVDGVREQFVVLSLAAYMTLDLEGGTSWVHTLVLT